MIEVRGLGKTFFGVTPVVVFEGLSARFEPAQVTAILGPSGSGKSTLLHLLGGLDKPTAGGVWWNEVEITSLSRERLARLRAQKLGFVFQLHFLLPELTALENVLLPTVLAGRMDQGAAQEILGLVGLSGREHHLPSQLSGGERQRVAVARALVARPRIVLADEPTGSLDRKSARVVFDLLLDLARQRGAGVVVATHDEGLLDGCDRVLDLVAGVLRERPRELRLV